jgi:hypothetical protein
MKEQATHVNAQVTSLLFGVGADSRPHNENSLLLIGCTKLSQHTIMLIGCNSSLVRQWKRLVCMCDDTFSHPFEAISRTQKKATIFDDACGVVYHA